MNLVTDKGPCNLDLRKSCIYIAVFFLVCELFSLIFLPGTLTHSSTLIGFIIHIIADVALLYGGLKENAWGVLAWLIQAVVYFITWPIAVLGVIFNYGGYRQATGSNNIIYGLLIYIVDLIFYAYCARLVYSYFVQLRNRNTTPQHAVVV